MNGGKRIIAIDHGTDGESDGDMEWLDHPGDGAGGTAPLPNPQSNASEDLFDWIESPKPGSIDWRRWLGRAALAIGIMGWTILFLIGNQHEIVGHPSAADLGDLIGAWSMPVALMLVARLVLRPSWKSVLRHESAEVAALGKALGDQSRQLEQRLAAMNTELAIARDFIAAQGRDLESLGRLAVERLSDSAGRLQELVISNGQEIERIGTVSSHALDNLDSLRGQLPVVGNAARDVANSIAHAGHAAQRQVEDMAGAFLRLRETGEASERQVSALRDQVDAALTAFAAMATRIGEAGEQRLSTMSATLESHRVTLDAEERAALTAMRARADSLAQAIAEQRQVIARAEEESIAALGTRLATLTADAERVRASLARAIEEIGRDHDGLLVVARERLESFETATGEMTSRLLAEADRLNGGLGERRAALDATMEAALADITARLGQFDAAIASRRERQLASARELVATCDHLGQRIAAFSEAIEQARTSGTATTQQVDTGLERLTSRIEDLRGRLAGTDSEIAGLTDAAVRLLELIQAGSDHTRAQLPEALRSAEAGLAQAEARVVGLRDTLREAGSSGSQLAEQVGAARAELVAVTEDARAFEHTLTEHAYTQGARIRALRDELTGARGDSDSLARAVETRLSQAIATLTEAAGKAGDELREATASAIDAIAGQLGEKTGAAAEAMLDGKGRELVTRLESAVVRAGEAGSAMGRQLTEQLARVEELASHLERRIEDARRQGEAQIDDDFARRAALIRDHLASTSVDLVRALSRDVSDVAWGAYLRGDRGIFTRRAVTLLENSEARAIQHRYEADPAFREHVNRYVHDFEAMLREILSTRDGHALGVTLLSSDMGKLYVALAQGIERLRN